MVYAYASPQPQGDKAYASPQPQGDKGYASPQPQGDKGYASHGQRQGLVDVRVARIFDTYGPRMPLSVRDASSSPSLSSSLLMGQFIAHALQGSDITVTATPSIVSSSSSTAAAGTNPLFRYRRY